MRRSNSQDRREADTVIHRSCGQLCGQPALRRAPKPRIGAPPDQIAQTLSSIKVVENQSLASIVTVRVTGASRRAGPVLARLVEFSARARRWVLPMIELAAALPAAARSGASSALVRGGRRSRSARGFGACTVRGEMSGFSRAASGHCYFTLKDADGGAALLRCAMFRRAAQPARLRAGGRPAGRAARPAGGVRAARRAAVRRRGDAARRRRRALRAIPAPEGAARGRGPVRRRRASAPLPPFPRRDRRRHLARRRGAARRADHAGAARAARARWSSIRAWCRASTRRPRWCAAIATGGGAAPRSTC